MSSDASVKLSAAELNRIQRNREKALTIRNNRLVQNSSSGKLNINNKNPNAKR